VRAECLNYNSYGAHFHCFENYYYYFRNYRYNLATTATSNNLY